MTSITSNSRATLPGPIGFERLNLALSSSKTPFQSIQTVPRCRSSPINGHTHECHPKPLVHRIEWRRNCWRIERLLCLGSAVNTARSLLWLQTGNAPCGFRRQGTLPVCSPKKRHYCEPRNWRTASVQQH
ncbi:unnamed protein product, partial [Nesidiocoris tenuis]